MLRPPSLLGSLLVLVSLATVVSSAPAVVPLTLPSGKVLQVEVMEREQDLTMGLMFRPSLPEDHGMLFVFQQADFHGFWMKNCRFAIDMVWLDMDHKVVHVAEAVPPCRTEPCPVYTPMQRANYVVEMGAGQAKKEKAVLGATLSFELPR